MRIDKYLAEKYGSRTRAERAIMSGIVLVNGCKVVPSYEVKADDIITFQQVETSYVSMGGYKLDKALDDFSLDVSEKIFADIGASTGGFTDCLLQRGASKIYCIDVGESQLDKSLLSKNVVVIDNFNARNLSLDMFNEPLDGIVGDLSFISLTYILPAVSACLSPGGIAILLIKPQFELDKTSVGKHGIVNDKNLRKTAVKRVYDCAVECGLSPVNITQAPVRKNKNIEYPLMLIKGGIPTKLDKLFKCASL